MAGNRRFTFVAILVLVPLTTGCSMLFMRRPPKAEGPVAVDDCTRSLAAPVLDVGFGVISLARATEVWDARGEFDTDEAYDDYRVASAVNAAALAASAIHGFKWSAECRRRATLSEQAMRDHLRTLAAQYADDRPKQDTAHPLAKSANASRGGR